MKCIRTILTVVLVMISSITIAQNVYYGTYHDSSIEAEIQKNAAYQPVVDPEWGIYGLGMELFDFFPVDDLNRMKADIIPKDATFSDSLYHAALEGDSAATYKLAYCYALGRGVGKNETKAKTLYTRLTDRGQASWIGLMDFYLCTGILIINDSLKNKAIEDKFAPYVSLFDGEQAANLGYSESLYYKAIIRCPCSECERLCKIGCPVFNIDINLMSKLGLPQSMYACAVYQHDRGKDDLAYQAIKETIWFDEDTFKKNRKKS